MDDFYFSDQKDGISILLIEDSAMETMLIKDKLQRLWLKSKVTTSKSISQAHKLLREKDFDMIVLDLNLPDSFGPKSVEDIRKINKDAPIIVLTGFATTITIEESMKYGATHVIEKSTFMDNAFRKVGFIN